MKTQGTYMAMKYLVLVVLVAGLLLARVAVAAPNAVTIDWWGMGGGGVGPLLQGHTAPVLEVHRATADDVAVLGVVRSRGEFYAARGDHPLDNSDIVQSAAGDAAPGDYVLVVTSGLAQVRVAPDVSDLAPGHALAVDGPSGRVTLAQDSADPALAFGRAMEAQPDGDGLIWALVGAQ